MFAISSECSLSASCFRACDRTPVELGRRAARVNAREGTSDQLWHEEGGAPYPGERSSDTMRVHAWCARCQRAGKDATRTHSTRQKSACARVLAPILLVEHVVRGTIGDGLCDATKSNFSPLRLVDKRRVLLSLETREAPRVPRRGAVHNGNSAREANPSSVAASTPSLPVIAPRGQSSDRAACPTPFAPRAAMREARQTGTAAP